MKLKEYSVMILLSALWGSSFLFMKISAPELGPLLTANLRVIIATIVIAIICLINRNKTCFLKNWRKYLILGALNAALPFALICTAELHIDASIAAILNATTPAFTALVAALWNKETLKLNKLIGLGFGLLGVIILVGVSGINNKAIWIYAPLSVLAAISYGFAGVYSSKAFKNLNPLNLAFGQQLSASIILLPFTLLQLPHKLPSEKAIISVILLGVFCTGIAYLLYFYLIKKVGPVKTLIATYVVPVFGMLWSILFLGELLKLQNIIGLLVIVFGILIVNNQIPTFMKKE